ncbi:MULTISPECIES: hypothetical protein [Burkholderia]|uniref:hypothetical protein n=1 Tax=Burkholderia TaxID=32008 RepID=UPI000A3FF4CD|nr:MULTISPECIES: hypothetical protein [unclassified Burkholderia]
MKKNYLKYLTILGFLVFDCVHADDPTEKEARGAVDRSFDEINKRINRDFEPGEVPRSVPPKTSAEQFNDDRRRACSRAKPPCSP